MTFDELFRVDAFTTPACFVSSTLWPARCYASPGWPTANLYILLRVICVNEHPANRFYCSLFVIPEKLSSIPSQWVFKDCCHN